MNPPAYFPGTRVPAAGVGLLNGLFVATNGITLSQVCEITGLEAGTVQNWVKRGFVNPPVGRKYSKSQVARIILINLLKDAFTIEKIATLLSHVNGNLLDRSDDIMDDSEIYQCLCDIVITSDEMENTGVHHLFAKIEERLGGFQEPFPGAGDRLRLALKAMICAYQAARFKRIANELAEGI